jgi:type IV secretory pathway protease TraF
MRCLAVVAKIYDAIASLAAEASWGIVGEEVVNASSSSSLGAFVQCKYKIKKGRAV